MEKIVEKRKVSKVECFEHLHPQIIPMLTALKESDIRIGLITNCYFDAVCMSCELGIKKPDIEIFQRCVSGLSVMSRECLYVGDGGSFELEAARSLGMQPIQAAWYLKNGVKQPAKRKDGFLQAESPMDIVLKAKEEYLL